MLISSNSSKTNLRQTALAIAEAKRRGLTLPPDALTRLKLFGVTLAPRRQSNCPDWQGWLIELFPVYVARPFAQRHQEFWDWVWAIELGVRPQPLVAIWPRGGAKSTSAELAAVALGERKRRKYAIYLSGAQEQADKHVETISSLLEGIGVDRAVNKYGSSKGWRRNRLRTAEGFTVDSLGLDTASRGIKTEEQRPDVIIIDDVDDRHDSAETTKKKKETITETILPSGSTDCAVLFVQNLVHPKSVAAQLASAQTDFLIDRVLSGPHPALLDFAYEVRDGRFVITAGAPTWDGQDVAACENYINTWGLISFTRECQHQLDDAEDALWKREWIDQARLTEAPEGLRVVVAVDPSASSKDGSDEAGIITMGEKGRRGYLLADDSLRASPDEWATRAVCAFIIHQAAFIVGEGNNGGEMVEAVIRGVTRERVVEMLMRLGFDSEWAEAHAIGGRSVAYKMVWASDGKQTRAQPASAAYQRGIIHHVGSFSLLETELCNWVPGKGKSPNRLDADVWALNELGLAQPVSELGGIHV